MSEKAKTNNVSIRLNDEDLKKLEFISSSFNIQKSTMAANIVSNVLNENMQEFEINNISYPRPVIKKLFSMQTDQQIIIMIAHNNQYNKGIIESAKHHSSNYEILNKLKKGWKRAGCEIRTVSFDNKQVLEIHHEMEKKWSVFTCTTTSFILEILDNEIKYTKVEDDWFKIEYVPT